MEKENGKLRKEHEKNERKRLVKMVARAKDNDPRIKAHAAMVEAERNAVKKAKKDAIANKYKHIEDAKAEAAKKVSEEKADAEKAKQAAVVAKREAGKKYRLTVKEITIYCAEQMPTCIRFDKYYLEEMFKKYPKQEQLDGLFEQLKGFTDDDFETQFETEIVKNLNKPKLTAEQLRN